MRGLATPPELGRIGQFQPVPLGFIPRSVRDDRVGTFGSGAARLAVRTQIPRPDIAGQALIRQPEPQLFELVEQGAGPQVRILSQPGADIVDERLERIRTQPRPHPRRSLPRQIIPHRLTVPTGVSSDRRDRPTTFTKGMYFHIVL